MRKFCRSCLKYVLIVSLYVSSVTTIIINLTGNNFDPIKEIQRLKSKNRRDDALDLARFYWENQTSDADKIANLEKCLTYTTAEKIKSFVWYGAIKGEIIDTYSGLGAISTDLCIEGDIRDLGIQSWKYLTSDRDFNKSITLLSVAGVCRSAATCLDGINALAKTRSNT